VTSKRLFFQENVMFASMRVCIIGVILSLFFSEAAFSLQPPDTTEQPKAPLGSQYQTFQPADALPEADDADAAEENLTGVITLDRALSLGFLQNPELSSFSWEVRAAQARRIQEGLLLNPEIEASVENFGGDNGLEKFDGAETTVQLSQMIELGGKRAARTRTAELEKETARWDYESKRLDVFADISKSFWDVIAAQEQCAIAGEIAAVADDAYQVAAERVKAGKVAPLEEIQSRVTVTTARIGFEQAGRALETARKKLAATWGCARPEFEKATADMGTLVSPPSFDNLVTAMSRNPDIAKWETEMERQRTQVRLADAGRIPDLTVGAGPRYYNESDDTAFVMNVSLPIPVFNRNQGAVQEARFNLARARLSRKAAVLKTENDLGQAYQALTASFSIADSLEKTALPAAETAFSAAMEGYREGKISYIAVLETRRTYFEVKQQYISAIVDYHKSKADIERLIGREIHEPQ
jgi:cobalt-zinc-cadmium efflux system outer membrane protein